MIEILSFLTFFTLLTITSGLWSRMNMYGMFQAYNLDKIRKKLASINLHQLS